MEIQKNVKKCEMCKDDEAKTLCLDCHSYFCEVCYKCVHDRKKIAIIRKKKLIYSFLLIQNVQNMKEIQ